MASFLPPFSWERNSRTQPDRQRHITTNQPLSVLISLWPKVKKRTKNPIPTQGIFPASVYYKNVVNIFFHFSFLFSLFSSFFFFPNPFTLLHSRPSYLLFLLHSTFHSPSTAFASQKKEAHHSFPHPSFVTLLLKRN